jgi:hypothetical protein
MAKQDLVVKLMLDSGAFGNDLRQAERKAQEFSNKMKDAGKTAGDFGKEIGLSAGALGKLGGMLTGAGAVVAAVGAFKSIMESSHDSAKKFQGVIGGFKGVLDNFQHSLSNMDFSNFNKGLKQVYENAKQAQQVIMDTQLSSVAYNIVDKDTRLKLKEYEVEYRKKETTPERRKEIEQLRDELLINARKTAEAQADNLYTSVIAQIVSKNANIGDLGGNLDKTKELIPYKKMKELMLEASYDLIFNRDEAEKERWQEIADQLTKLDIAADTNSQTSSAYTWHQPPAWLEFLPWVKKSRDAWKKQSAEHGKVSQEARAEWERLVMEYQDLMIKNVLYTIGKEGLSTISSDMTTSFDIVAAIDELLLQGMGWSAPSEQTTGGGGGNVKEEIEVLIDSITDLDKRLKIAQEKLAGQNVGTDDWWAIQAEVDELTLKLNAALLLKAKLLNPMEPLPKLPNILPKGLTAPEKGIKNPFLSTTEDEEEVGKLTKDYEGLNTVLSSTVFLFNSLGSAIEDSGDKSSQNAIAMMNIFSAIAEGALNVIPALQALTAAEGTAQAAKVPWPANIAAILSIVATVTSVFASIKQIKKNKFAEGGIVGGTSYSGDKLFAMVNSGEMILNKRQQGNLANMLGGGGQVEFHISGDSLVGVLNNKRNKTNLTR